MAQSGPARKKGSWRWTKLQRPPKLRPVDPISNAAYEDERSKQFSTAHNPLRQQPRRTFYERLGISRELYLSWISALFALLFFSLTVFYTVYTSLFARISYISGQSSRLILILRILSELAGIFLLTTIHGTFDTVQWLRISSKEGLKLLDFLSLQAGTGILGLMGLVVSGGLPPCKETSTARLLSGLRLVSEAVIPVLSVLIMANVNTIPIFHPSSDPIEMPFGMGTFNGSVAAQFGVMQDLLFNMNYGMFLTNGANVLDITPDEDRHAYCSSGVRVYGNQSCNRVVAVHGNLQLIDSKLPNFSENRMADTLLSENQQIYVLQMRDDDDFIFDHEIECLTFASGTGAYQFCVANRKEDGALIGRMIPCPQPIANKSSCLTNTTWHTSTGWSTSLKASFRNATVAYNRINNTIMSSRFISDPRPAQIDAADVRTALKSLLQTEYVASNASLSTPILGSPTHFFGRLIVGHMYRLSNMIESNPEINSRGYNAVQCLLAMSLYYCQLGTLAGTVLPFAATTSSLFSLKDSLFTPDMPRTSIRLAEMKYELHIGRATKLAYICLGSITLLCCIVVLIYSTVRDLVSGGAETTLYPALDVLTNTKIVDDKTGMLAQWDTWDDLRNSRGRQWWHTLAGLKVLYREPPDGRRKRRRKVANEYLAGSRGLNIAEENNVGCGDMSPATKSSEIDDPAR